MRGRAAASDPRLFRSAMDCLADAILLVDRSTLRIIDANATACRMFGYSRAELLAMEGEAMAAMPPDPAEPLYAMIVAGDDFAVATERMVRHRDGSILQVELKRQLMETDEGWIIVAALRDITAEKQVERRLHELAHYDALSGLPNRTLFYETLAKSVGSAALRQQRVAVLFIDLDRFKSVNDTLGHDAGDALLRQFGDRLMQCVRVRDTIGRLGGDEFAMILVAEDAKQTAALIVSKIQEALRPLFDLNGHEVAMSASIGIAVHPEDAGDADGLIKCADTAMYRAKQSGGATSRFFTAQMNIDLLERIALEAALRQAVEQSEFLLHYQPIYDLGSGRIVGVEALLRWARPGHGLIAPADFMEVLEDTGLIVPVGIWVLKAVCRQIGAWACAPGGPLPISINVSCKQFADSHFQSEIAAAIRESGIPGRLLELELTEATLMADAALTAASLQRLNAMGVKVSIDDFGTGHSSLGALGRFAIDTLQIDRSFVRNATSQAEDAAIVCAIVALGHSLGLRVIAEGVETVEQLSFLRRHGCDGVQGYHCGRPVPVAEIARMIGEGVTLAVPGAPRRIRGASQRRGSAAAARSEALGLTAEQRAAQVYAAGALLVEVR